ncbi:MAG TPA: Mth938-like domain-containing protein [Allosphingosinicella sp.]|nr:Mth938-like domain-containing protein [Allosphingosinicella sp.]
MTEPRSSPGFERSPAGPGPLIQGFAGTGFRVDGEIYQAVLLTPERALAWTPPALAELGLADVEVALGAETEFLIIGTGPAQAFPPRAFVAALEGRGIGIEAMDSRAAARAWTMLRGEGRRIAAALLPL